METTEFQLGIVSYGLYLPSGFETAEEIAKRSGLSREQVIEDLGVERKCFPAAEDLPVVMAVKAARQALERAPDVDPGEIDVVIWIGEEYKDYICQTAGIRVQEELGARKAWGFDLIGQGTTSLVGLRTAQDLMIGDPAVRTVLLAGGTRNIDLVDYSNPHTRWMLSTSASGAALLLRRRHPYNRLLGTAFSVDSEMADEAYVPGGGDGTALQPENLEHGIHVFPDTPPAGNGSLHDRTSRRAAGGRDSENHGAGRMFRSGSRLPGPPTSPPEGKNENS